MSVATSRRHREIVVGVGSVATYTPELMMHVAHDFVCSRRGRRFGFVAGLAPREVVT